MKVDLFCVQPYMRPQDYFTREAFYHRIDRYFQAADLQRTPDTPTLIVFPEDIATFLLLEGQEETLKDVRTMEEGFAAIGQKNILGVLRTMAQYATINKRQAFFTRAAARLWHIWHGTMVRLAHDYRMTVVAGSALLPESRWMYDTNRFMPKSPKVYNMSFTTDPSGHVIYQTRKVNLVPTQEDVLQLTPGPKETAGFGTTLPGTDIPMATAICYDAFWRPHSEHEPHFTNVLELMDRAGVRLVAQPSANPWWWNEPWPFDPPGSQRLRRQQWDEEGSLATLAGCRNVEIVVNPQLLMEFLDIHFDGESRIIARTGAAVETLARSHRTSGPEGDMVLHTTLDFATMSTESKM